MLACPRWGISTKVLRPLRAAAQVLCVDYRPQCLLGSIVGLGWRNALFDLPGKLLYGVRLRENPGRSPSRRSASRPRHRQIRCKPNANVGRYPLHARQRFSSDPFPACEVEQHKSDVTRTLLEYLDALPGRPWPADPVPAWLQRRSCEISASISSSSTTRTVRCRQVVANHIFGDLRPTLLGGEHHPERASPAWNAVNL